LISKLTIGKGTTIRKRTTAREGRAQMPLKPFHLSHVIVMAEE
jgi:hypothetical protein